MNKLVLIAAAAILPFAADAADLNGEIVTAAQHAELAAQATDINTVHMHLHHTVNCLVGPNGHSFDAKQLNPCANSGNGAIPDAGADDAKSKALMNAASLASEGMSNSDLHAARASATRTAAALKALE